ncbi:MerR family DNA-binding transcriptional regulator [Aneurinibacillus thermoaerophilus]|uniref:DNA-binding transcriptional regulator, MerR family n=1 Tax=Aneurinibacillus thermoaerophilus TaxID=143495 RepID=A0A1G7YCQ0_ANETH|nr:MULTISPECIES: MerR family DNA-binding transcriptional regulator [Aneurinibacillus]AMA72194.1 MerR family transcriptional regulator [Aneurinibacillus sp. XH2]MED0756034.1 MerR family DNA-binding transcriptional regulator [Aneurinibacillus thermoaerophilus]MED0759642.1 MerR family DNA-binding transcriptional regulator [Aneurinibacillus thermoaerophilus]SDG94164.1 DNA-binding transcriptional regulator, MerR family [Aneurinibacillus thermoaerophilus]
MKRQETYSISQLSSELDISTRTIRYYEERGLLHPTRSPGGTRRYTKADRARLKLILRGKRFGFSLDEIKEMLDLFYEDRLGVKQLERTIEYGVEKIKQVEEQIEELTVLRDELLSFKEAFEARLWELKRSNTENEGN